ncbi:acyl carrier protein [Alkalihalobacillus pseudalcaliphilus]|uniref:acyl carrier protein n=1 Tax=Alkalihalobacillus pseudalcaliphilus TaxID=79884 RepID=UPI00064D8A4E|nr:acyl carrier protein [Alkalihalobacillus pseudalcaliphilus]KMK76753.1 acyl carrier protein [Alkalihalobacillus pseudalcaliphilus]
MILKDKVVNVKKLNEIIADVLEVEVEEVEECEDLVEDLDADSMSLLELLVAIEKEFKVKIPEDKLVDFTSVSNIIEVLEGLAYGEI